MQVTKGTWRMREQCVQGSLSSSPAQEPGNEANENCDSDIVWRKYDEHLVVCIVTSAQVTMSKAINE